MIRPGSGGWSSRLFASASLLWLLSLHLVACRNRANDYELALDRAEAARRERSFEQERIHFDEARRIARDEDDRVEAAYRHAHALLREGRAQEARNELLALASSFPTSIRAARAWLDVGRIGEDLNESNRAAEAYRRVVNDYPSSGGARTAATRLAHLRRADGISLVDTYRELLQSTKSPDFEQELRWLIGQELEVSAPDLAIREYETLARRFPLPNGTLSDDALLASARLRRELGDSEGAREVLNYLLSFDTHAIVIGSYTRFTFVRAHFLKAAIEGEDLSRWDLALGSYRLFAETHPRSRYLDDARWNAARSRSLLGEDPCASLDELGRERPASRFVQCVEQMCSANAQPAARLTAPCSEWWRQGSSGPN